MAKAHSTGKMAPHTQASLKRMKSMALEPTSGVMEESTLVNGRMARCTARLSLGLLMARSTLEPTSRTRKAVSEKCAIKMAEFIEESGSSVKCMETGL